MASNAQYYDPGKPAEGADGLEVVPAHDPTLPEVAPPPHPWAPADEKGATATPVEGKKKILGLRRSTFILLALLLVVTVVAAVAGGVAGSRAEQNGYDRGFKAAQEAASTFPITPDPTSDSSDSSESSESPSPSQSGRIDLPALLGTLPLDCPNIDATTHKITSRQSTFTFRATCGADVASGEGDSNILTLRAYRLEDCLRACASLNERGNVDEDDECGAVLFHVDLKFVESHGGNCWLKKGVERSVVDEGARNERVLLELQEA